MVTAGDRMPANKPDTLPQIHLCCAANLSLGASGIGNERAGSDLRAFLFEKTYDFRDWHREIEQV
jgi:hypothetical protein